MRIRTTGILGLFFALALGVPTVVSCAASSSSPGGAGGSAGNYGTSGCTKSPQQVCTQCNNSCAQCMCFSADTSQCAPLCNGNGSGGSGVGGTGAGGSSGSGGSVSSGGTGGGAACTPGHCGQCTSCFDKCVCGGGKSTACLSACGGTGGTGGSGFGGSGFGGSGFGGSGFGGSGFGGSGTGGSGGGTANLGAQCTTNSDCGTVGICATANSSIFGSGGPSRGYCTASCTQNSDCTSLSPNAQCVDFGTGSTYCLLGCNSSSSDPCLDRYDEMCFELVSGDAGAGVEACSPECATDADCNGLKCDLSTGLCTSSPKTGSPIGTNCNPSASTDPCAGFCISTSSTDPTQGECTAVCNAGANSTSFGVIGACGSDPTPGSPQDAACVYTATMPNNSTIGICGQLCNCNSDCRTSNTLCESWADAGISNPSQYTSTFGKAGLCVDSSTAGVSGIACSDAGL